MILPYNGQTPNFLKIWLLSKTKPWSGSKLHQAFRTLAWNYYHFNNPFHKRKS